MRVLLTNSGTRTQLMGSRIKFEGHPVGQGSVNFIFTHLGLKCLVVVVFWAVLSFIYQKRRREGTT